MATLPDTDKKEPAMDAYTASESISLREAIDGSASLRESLRGRLPELEALLEHTLSSKWFLDAYRKAVPTGQNDLERDVLSVFGLEACQLLDKQESAVLTVRGLNSYRTVALIQTARHLRTGHTLPWVLETPDLVKQARLLFFCHFLRLLGSDLMDPETHLKNLMMEMGFDENNTTQTVQIALCNITASPPTLH